MKVGEELNENLTIEYKRMLQRRGNKSELGDLVHAEIALVEDEESLYYGVNDKALKVLGESSLENSLTSTDSSKVLTANKGRELDIKISTLQEFVNSYMLSVNEQIEGKQDTIIHKSPTPPTDTEMIWFKTNE